VASVEGCGALKGRAGRLGRGLAENGAGANDCFWGEEGGNEPEAGGPAQVWAERPQQRCCGGHPRAGGPAQVWAEREGAVVRAGGLGGGRF